MTENEAIKIIEGIEEVRGDLPEDGNDIAIWQLKEIGCELGQKMDEIKESMEKQRAKKPIPNILTWACPKCRNVDLEELNESGYTVKKYSYCPDCGQKIDWGE